MSARRRRIGSRPYHMADKISEDGRVSAVCFTSRRAINLKLAYWTNRWEAVTCKKCLALRPREGTI